MSAVQDSSVVLVPETAPVARAVLRWMRRATPLVLFLTAAALTLASTPLVAQSGSPPAPLSAAAVREARAHSNRAIAVRDTTALVSMVTASYHSVSSRNAHTNGRDGARVQWRQQFAAHPDVQYVRTPSAVRVFVPWEMAEETGAWVGRWRESDGAVEIRGSYTAKWRRVDGRWLLEAELFTPTACSGSAYCRTSPPQP